VRTLFGEGTGNELDPDLALGNGRLDPILLLCLWLLRQSVFPLMWLGFIIAVLTTSPERFAEEASVISESGVSIGLAFSPFAVVALAFAIRWAISAVAVALAFPLSGWVVHGEHYRQPGLRGRVRSWWDRLHVTRAYRSLRWTRLVRNRAIERLGSTGSRLQFVSRVLRWSNLALPLFFLVAVWI
jgi:hypothetical protein